MVPGFLVVEFIVFSCVGCKIGPSEGEMMELRNVVVAVDNSDASRNAARFAAYLAGFLGGELTVLSVFPAAPAALEPEQSSGGIHAMLGRSIFAAHPSLAVDVTAVRGVPQVEIPRFAERTRSNLIVLARKPRSRMTRLIMGDTTDAVVRRSRLPCLLVPAGLGSMRRVLVALDGTDRGMAVFQYAVALAARANLEISAVIVEPRSGEGPQLVSTRADHLAEKMEGVQKRIGSGDTSVATSILSVRHGNVVDEIVAEAQAVGADILVTGFHPGGPLLEVDEMSVSRSLVHRASCAVLTVPL